MRISSRANKPFTRRLVKYLTGTLFIGAMGVSTSIQAHEPLAVSWNILEAETTGTYEPGANGVDHRLQVELFPSNEHQHNVLLVVFNGCSDDATTIDESLQNPNKSVMTPGAKPDVIDVKHLEPHWRACPEQKYLLVKNHQQLRLDVDFIRDENEGMSVQLGGKVFVVPYQLLNATTNPHQLAILLRNTHHTAELVINLMYRLNTRKNVWQFNEHETIFNRANKVPKVPREHKKMAVTIPVSLEAFQVKPLLPGEKPLPALEKGT